MTTTLKTIIVAVIGLIIGVAIGTAAQSNNETEPAPAITVTATPEPAPTVTVTEANPDCQAAFDAADEMILVGSELASLIRQHLNDEQIAWEVQLMGDMNHLTDVYLPQLEDFGMGVKDLNAKIDASTYPTLRENCLG